MKRNKKILIFVACIILLTNTFLGAFETLLDQRYYRYSNYNGSLTFEEFMSRDFEMMKRRHKMCVLAHPDL